MIKSKLCYMKFATINASKLLEYYLVYVCMHANNLMVICAVVNLQLMLSTVAYCARIQCRELWSPLP